MAIRIILALLLLVALMWFASWLGKATPMQRSQAFKLIVLYGSVGLILLLVVTGRVPWLFALAGVLVPWIQRLILAKRAWNIFKAYRGPSQGQTSRVETAWLRMSLDHDSGDLDGEVLGGRFRGARLSRLDLDELLELRVECRRNDADSVSLLEAYLDRVHGDAWRERASAGPAGAGASGGGGPMNREEALAILGLVEGAGRDQVIDAHRRLMQKLHPDRGGSDYLAARINQAKDYLLGE
jgi:hypothetical protein